jgi:hypothetical protein
MKWRQTELPLVPSCKTVASTEIMTVINYPLVYMEVKFRLNTDEKKTLELP